MDSQPVQSSQQTTEQQKLSSHAKRRQQRKMKKEENTSSQTSGTKQEVIEDNNKSNKQDKPRQKLDQGKQQKYIFQVKKKDDDQKVSQNNEDSQMFDEGSSAQASSQVEEKKQKQKNSYKKPEKPQVEILQPFEFGRKDKVKVSTEKGFTGHSDKWFDEDRFNKPRSSANFDKANDHDYYFNSYSSHHIHEEMLKDQSRTLAYQSAIEGNKIDFKDKIVLDIGCGTGILSIFAVRAGAKHVYAIDNAEIALFAREIVKDNGMSDKITVFKGKVEEVEFPFKEGEVDIIISEWMGYFLLYESMLDCVLWARDKYLNKKTGKMLPDRATMYMAAVEDSQFMGDKTNFWKDVYGVNMQVMTRGIFKDPMVDTVPPGNIMSDACCILDLDLVHMDKKEVEFSNFYSLNMNYNDNVHAFVVWFDTTFQDLQNPVVLSTSPMQKYTHWKQSVLYLERPLQVRKGDVLQGSIAVRQDRKNFRELNIKMSFHMDNFKGQKHFDQLYKFR